MFIPKILLGQSTNEIKYVRGITGAVLTGLFLNYNYQGNNIDQLTSPLELKKYETFDEILGNNLTIYSLPIFYEWLHADIARPYPRTPKDYFNDRIKIWTISHVRFGRLFYHIKSKYSGESQRHILAPIIKIPTNFSEMKIMLDLSYYVETISKCGQEAYADTLPFVDKLRSKLQIDKSLISQSKIAVGQMYHLWHFECLQMTAEEYARRRFGLIESGLVGIWNEWKYHLESWNDTVQEAKQVSSLVKPLSLKGNLVVVFYVDLALKSLCLFIFVCEGIKYFKNLIVQTTLSVFMVIKFVYFVFSKGVRKILRRFECGKQ